MKERFSQCIQRLLITGIVTALLAVFAAGEEITPEDIAKWAEEFTEETGIELPDEEEVNDFLDTVKEGAMQYMTEEEYEELKQRMQDSVDELIRDFSGGLELPQGLKLSEEEVGALLELIRQIAQHTSDGTGDSDGPSVYAGGDASTVASDDELMDLIFAAQTEMADYLVFETENGYEPDYNSDSDDFWDRMYVEIANRDPIIGAGFMHSGIGMGRSGSQYVMTFNYEDKESVRRMRDESRQSAAGIADSLMQDGMDDLAKVSAVNSYLCDSVYYPGSEPYPLVTHMVYGAVEDTCAVCEGYAGAAAAILRDMGVDCMIEVGPVTDGGGHAWNLVKVDGNWYQLDVTWNDNGFDRLMYFLVTDDYMRESRSWDYDFFPSTPAAPYLVR